MTLDFEHHIIKSIIIKNGKNTAQAQLSLPKLCDWVQNGLIQEAREVDSWRKIPIKSVSVVEFNTTKWRKFMNTNANITLTLHYIL